VHRIQWGRRSFQGQHHAECASLAESLAFRPDSAAVQLTPAQRFESASSRPSSSHSIPETRAACRPPRGSAAPRIPGFRLSLPASRSAAAPRADYGALGSLSCIPALARLRGSRRLLRSCLPPSARLRRSTHPWLQALAARFAVSCRPSHRLRCSWSAFRPSMASADLAIHGFT
jgi:hypothetical protein